MGRKWRERIWEEVKGVPWRERGEEKGRGYRGPPFIDPRYAPAVV